MIKYAQLEVEDGGKLEVPSASPARACTAVGPRVPHDYSQHG